MPCLKRRAARCRGHWKDGGLTSSSPTSQREAALAAPAFDPGWARDEGVGARPESHSDDWLRSSSRRRVDARSHSTRRDPSSRPPELSLLEVTFDPGSGVDPHFHKGHSDSFYVLEGEVEFHVGDEVVHGTPGTYVLAPPNVVHWFRNVSDEPVRMLNLHTPGGFAQYRRELAGASRRRGSSRTRAFFERHDVFDV